MSFKKFVSFVKQSSLSITNRYLVEITGPSTSNFSANISNENLSLLCDAVSHPAVSIRTKDATLYGAPIMRPDGGIDFDNIINMSFILDQNQFVKEYFLNWMNLIVDKNSFLVGYQDDYMAHKISIHQLDKADQIKYTTELYDIYPIGIGAVVNSASDSNSFTRLPVNFTFRKWQGYSLASEADLSRLENLYNTTIINQFNGS